MTQRTLQHPYPGGLHVAVIMDGNGRWAGARGLPRSAGHREGAKAVRRAVEAAPNLGIRLLTLYAFSSDNWQRPKPEVSALMELFRKYLLDAREKCVEKGVRVSLIGRRDRLSADLLGAAANLEEATAQGETMHLRLAVDYSGRDSLVQASHLLQCPNGNGRVSFARCLGHAMRAGEPAVDVDLLIRTGGEQRLSDFLLWECAYAELYFTPCLWPDFTAEDLEAAVEDFHRRERRFGRVEQQGASTEPGLELRGVRSQ